MSYWRQVALQLPMLAVVAQHHRVTGSPDMGLPDGAPEETTKLDNTKDSC